MNPDTDHSGTESLRDQLADDAAHLPALAVQAARERCAQRTRTRRQLARAAVLVLLGVCTWEAVDWTASHWTPKRRPDGEGMAASPGSPQRPGADRLENVVRVQTVEEAVTSPLPLPAGTTEEQRALLESARGLPLLLVMDSSGKPKRIVVVER